MSLVPNDLVLEVYKGEDVTFPFRRAVPSGNITGWTITLTVKAKTDLSTIVIQKTATVTSGVNQTFSVAFAAADLTITAQDYVFDIQRTDVGSIRVLAYGTFRVLQDVRVA